MKKTAFTSFTLLCLLFTTFLIGYNVSVKATPDVIHVPTQYQTIQEAINHANSGDTIIVYNNTYYENVFVNKSVSLVGENRETTIMDGAETGNVITVTANNVKINGFTIQKSGDGPNDSGILINYSRGNEISHNTITNNHHGILLENSRDNTLSDNNVTSNNYHGIRLDSSTSNVISKNTVKSNNEDGIRLDSSTNNVICTNHITSNNYNGIRLSSSSSNVISDNNVTSNNINGIRLSSSNNNVISRNHVISNNINGIRLVSSSNNTIYHNNFNNIDQVWNDSTNVWDNDEEGNYWSDYTGGDQNEDGIGDNPYVMDMNNRDDRPLIGMFSEFKVAWEDEIHQATAISNSTISNFRFDAGKETGNKIISFNVTGENGTVGFCRVMIPKKLMNYSLVVLVDGEEIIPNFLDISNETRTRLYFKYVHSSHTITIISSKLLNGYTKLQTDFHNLNSTFHQLLDNYSQLLESFNSLNTAYQELTGNYSQLLENYSQLLEIYSTINTSYQEHLLNYSELQKNQTSILLEHTQNIRNLTYVFIATTAVFIMAAVYLSTHAHRKAPKTETS